MKPVSFLLFLPFLFSVFLAGCARNQIVIDRQYVDMAAYERDLAECRSYAEETGSVGADAAKGAVGGAVVGGAIGAVVGNSRTAGKLGGVGAITGGVRGGAKSRAEKNRIIKRCLSGRGYRVLN